jgi:hypothetical protein
MLGINGMQVFHSLLTPIFIWFFFYPFFLKKVIGRRNRQAMQATLKQNYFLQIYKSKMMPLDQVFESKIAKTQKFYRHLQGKLQLMVNHFTHRMNMLGIRVQAC